MILIILQSVYGNSSDKFENICDIESMNSMNVRLVLLVLIHSWQAPFLV